MARRVLLTSARSPREWNGPTAFPFRIRRRPLGLYLIAENVAAPVLVAERCDRDAFARLLERERPHLVGISMMAQEIDGARDLARLVRLVLPTAEIFLGGPGSRVDGVERLVDCDEVVAGDGVAAIRARLGEDPDAPIRLPALPAAARLTATGHNELALLVAGLGMGPSRRTLFESGEALFAEACRLGQELSTETFYIPDEGFLADRVVVRGLLSAMERAGRPFEFAIHARASDVANWDPEELARLGVFGLLLAAQRWTEAEVQLVRRLHEHGVAVHAPVLVGPDSSPEELEAALALGADAVDFLPRLALPESPGLDRAQLDRLLESCDGGGPPTPLCQEIARVSAAEEARHGPPLLRLARTLVEGYRAHEFSDDPWMRLRMEKARRRVEDLRLLIAGTVTAASPPAEANLRRELERDFALLFGAPLISGRAMALGSQALQEFGTVFRKVRRVIDATGAQVRHYRWRQLDRRREAAKRARKFSNPSLRPPRPLASRCRGTGRTGRVHGLVRNPRQPLPTERRPTCSRCRQPESGCWCKQLVPKPTRSKFVLLQHPREARNLMGTAHMAHLGLAGSTLLVGIDFAANRDFGALLEQERERSVVLYPAPGARDVRELANRDPPPTVWVIDGTWKQAQKIWKKNPALHSLPAYRIEPRMPSQYGFRSEPEPHCISTIEAVAELLEALGESRPEDYEPFLAPFRALVGRQLGHANANPRRRGRARPPRPFVLPPPLGEHPERAVVFFVEGNGWPASWETRPPTEAIQAMAVRLATGERVGEFIRPRHGLSPTVLGNLELDESALAGWIEPEAMAQKWREFRKEGDVWCGWGHFSGALLANAGVDTAGLEVVDLRALAKRLMRARVGKVEQTYDFLQLPAPVPVWPGRGGRRMAMLEAVARAMITRAGVAAAG
ncbi:MAG: DTW domain-containing protein [Myxococcales bacterium]